MTRLDKVKDHLKSNKKTYLVGAGALAIGVVGTLVAHKIDLGEEGVSTVIKQFNIASSPVNVVTTTLERRGHPGNLVRCVETGEVFASQARAAEVIGVNPWNLSKHLRGLREDADGYTFIKLGEAA